MMTKKKYLGIDFGDKNVGLALAEEGSMAIAYKIIAGHDTAALLQELKSIVQEENIDMIVVGLPYSMSGSASQRTDITQNFIDLLKQDTTIPVATIDERLSSKLYENQGIKVDIDKYSAMAILQSYLDSQHVK